VIAMVKEPVPVAAGDTVHLALGVTHPFDATTGERL
jgi:hypothetical protein